MLPGRSISSRNRLEKVIRDAFLKCCSGLEMISNFVNMGVGWRPGRGVNKYVEWRLEGKGGMVHQGSREENRRAVREGSTRG